MPGPLEVGQKESEGRASAGQVGPSALGSHQSEAWERGMLS